MRLGALADIRQGMVMAGRGAGARPGDWPLQVIESADIVDNRLSLEGLRSVQVKGDHRSAAHLLRPLDILVTARSQPAKVALVPAGVSGTVAAVTLLVVRTPDPHTGLARFLWYYLASERGRADIASRLTGKSLPTLSVTALGNMQVPAPSSDLVRRLANLIVATEDSRDATLRAGLARHDKVRDAIAEELRSLDEAKRLADVWELDKTAAKPIKVPSIRQALDELHESERLRDEAAALMDKFLVGREDVAED